MSQNRNKLRELFIGNISNSIVHRILEKAIDDENIRKYYDKEFSISKDYAHELEKKKAIYKERTRTKKQITWCLIASNGVAKNSYFRDLISHVVTLKDLFD